MSSDESLSPIVTMRRVKKRTLTHLQVTPVQPKKDVASKLSLTKQRLAKENLDPLKTPDTASRNKVSASFLFSSCKKKQIEATNCLPGHTVLVCDSSDEEFVNCKPSENLKCDRDDEVVDESLVEYSLIRKWLQNAEDSFDSAEDSFSERKSVSDNGSSGDQLEVHENGQKSHRHSEDTIILSSDDDEGSPRGTCWRKLTTPPKGAPLKTNQVSVKNEPNLCDSFDSMNITTSLEERLAIHGQTLFRRNIIYSSPESTPVISKSLNKKPAVLCLSSDEEISSSPRTPPTGPKNSIRKNSQPMPTAIPESESELEDIFVSLTVDEVPVVKPKKVTKPRQKKKAPQTQHVFIQPDSRAPRSFLASLSSDTPLECRHADAIPYLKSFKKSRDELTTRLFTLFNERVFKNLLPRDFSITWNSRLTRTAGYCRHFTKRDNGLTNFESRIELSVKVVDTPCRLRDTLVHELCHAATWVIDNCRGGHGPVWRKWANEALQVFPELPPITRCHNYEITYKFYYNCGQCSYSTGRHSKSIDTTTQVCPLCRGQLQLSKEPASKVDVNIEATPKTSKTPRTPNAFAMFVKENYGITKSSRADLPHAAIMKLLSAKFAESKKQLV